MSCILYSHEQNDLNDFCIPTDTNRLAFSGYLDRCHGNRCYPSLLGRCYSATEGQCAPGTRRRKSTSNKCKVTRSGIFKVNSQQNWHPTPLPLALYSSDLCQEDCRGSFCTFLWNNNIAQRDESEVMLITIFGCSPFETWPLDSPQYFITSFLDMFSCP